MSTIKEKLENEKVQLALKITLIVLLLPFLTNLTMYILKFIYGIGVYVGTAFRAIYAYLC